MQASIARRVESIITPIVGMKNVRAEASAVIDFSTTEQAVIAPSFLGDDTGRCPVLVNINSLEKETRYPLLERLIKNTQDREKTFFSLLLASDKPINRLAKHLGERLNIQLSPNDTPMQFRYFDPATFTQLPHLLGEAGMAWLLGQIGSVLVPWVGEFTVFQTPQTKQSFKFKEAHVQGLHRISITNQVQLSQAQAPRDQREWVKRAQQMDDYINRALAHSLITIEDVVLFCTHAMLHHPCFDEHPRLQAIFNKLANATAEHDMELDYAYLTAQISDENWQTITAQLNAAH
jgi:hypothetical protein